MRQGLGPDRSRRAIALFYNGALGLIGDEVNVGDWVRILQGTHIGRRAEVLEVDGPSVIVRVTANSYRKASELRLGPDQFRPAKVGDEGSAPQIADAAGTANSAVAELKGGFAAPCRLSGALHSLSPGYCVPERRVRAVSPRSEGIKALPNSRP